MNQGDWAGKLKVENSFPDTHAAGRFIGAKVDATRLSKL